MVSIQTINYDEIKNPEEVINAFKPRIEKYSKTGIYFYFIHPEKKEIIGNIADDNCRFVMRSVFTRWFGKKYPSTIIIDGKASKKDAERITVKLRLSFSAIFALFIAMAITISVWDNFQLSYIPVILVLLIVYVVPIIFDIKKSEEVITNLIEYGERKHQLKRNEKGHYQQSKENG